MLMLLLRNVLLVVYLITIFHKSFGYVVGYPKRVASLSRFRYSIIANRCHSCNSNCDHSADIIGMVNHCDTTNSNINDNGMENGETIEMINATIKELRRNITELESTVKLQKMKLSEIVTKLSESGKNGCYLIQAQVANFLKEQQLEQSHRVANNKRQFIEDLLPLFDELATARSKLFAEKDKEIRMLSDFTTLGNNLKNSVLVKDSYQEYVPEIGSLALEAMCEATELSSPETISDRSRGKHNEPNKGSSIAGKKITKVLRSGVLGPGNSIIRRALVSVSDSPNESELTTS